MLQKIRHTFSLRDMPIWHKLLAVTLLVALLIGAVALGGFQLVTRQSNRMVYTQTAGSLTVVSDKTASRLNNLMDTSLYIAVNREFQRNLTTLDQKPTTSAQALARSQITSLLYRTFPGDTIAVSVFPLQASPIVLGFASLTEEDAVRARALAAEAKGAPVWLPAGYGDGSVLLAREIRNVNEPFLEPMGLLLLRVNLDKIVQESAEGLLLGEYNIAIRQEGEPLYVYTADSRLIPDESLFSGDAPYAIDRREGGEIGRAHV